MVWNNKLVSVILLSYNSMEYISRALDSVFIQDYPRIELIITDDGSEEFSKEEVQEYIDTHKTPNIERVCIITSPVNTGTVANLRRALSEIHGDYYINFGADDALYNNSVISAYIHTFFIRNWEPIVVTGKTGMYSKDLKHFERGLPTNEEIQVLMEEKAEATLNKLASSCAVVNVSSCFRSDFPELVDAYDTRYKLYEDYPTFIRMARKGYTPVFLNRYCTKHAYGGVANGTTSYELSKILYEDRNMMWETEFEPYRNLFSEQSIEANKKRREYEKKVYEKALLNETVKQKTVKGYLARAVVLFQKNKDKLANRSPKLDMYLQFAAICTILSFSLHIAEAIGTHILPNVIERIFGLVGIVIFIYCAVIALCKRSRPK